MVRKDIIITENQPSSALFSHTTEEPARGVVTGGQQTAYQGLFREPDYGDGPRPAPVEPAPEPRREVRAGARRTTRRRTAA